MSFDTELSATRSVDADSAVSSPGSMALAMRAPISTVMDAPDLANLAARANRALGRLAMQPCRVLVQAGQGVVVDFGMDRIPLSKLEAREWLDLLRDSDACLNLLADIHQLAKGASFDCDAHTLLCTVPAPC